MGGDSPHRSRPRAHHERLGLDPGRVATRTPRSSEPPRPLSRRRRRPLRARDRRGSAPRRRPASTSASRSASSRGQSRPWSAPPRATDRRGQGDDALWRAADAHQHVDAGTRLRRCIAGATSPSRMRLDTRLRVAQLKDEVVVPVALEHDHRHHLVHLDSFASATRVTFSVGEASMRRDRRRCLRPDGDLVHVDRGPREEHRDVAPGQWR